MAHANTQIVVMALIEHVDALDHLDGILSVEGIDFYGIGPKDLAQSMGLPGQMEQPASQGVHQAGDGRCTRRREEDVT